MEAMRRFLNFRMRGSRFLDVYGVFGLCILVLTAGFIGYRAVKNKIAAIIVPALASTADNATGFLWTDTFGWISVNCSNDWNGDGTVVHPAEDLCGGAGENYGVNVETLGTAGSISGYGWSPNAGLICFGSQCAGPAPDGSGPRADFDFGIAQTAVLQGWARIEAHQDETGAGGGGWIALGGSGPGAIPLMITLSVVEEPGGGSHLDFSGSGWQSNSGINGAGWVDFFDLQSSAVPILLTPLPDYETECADGDAAFCCSNGVDDDGDVSYTISNERDDLLLTGRDCEDYDCAGFPNCPAREDIGAGGVEAAEQCLDGWLDNDLDAYVRSGDVYAPAATPVWVDCTDSDCFDAPECNIPERCEDGLDNDRDGFADCSDIGDCSDFPLCIPGCQCSGNEECLAAALDSDRDGVLDREYGGAGRVCDNCPNLANEDQADANNNGRGDLCDAWIETQAGALYGRGFRAPAAPPLPNATFCIFSSGEVQNFVSEACVLPSAAQARVREFQLLQYPDTLALWSDTLRGRLDLNRLKRDAAELPVDLSGRLAVGGFRNLIAAGERVFHYQGDLTVRQNIVWPNDLQNGARTIIVEGNLILEGDSSYDSTPLPADASLRRLASAGWIIVDNSATEPVEGNIVIDPSVGELVGAYVASGTISTGTFGGLTDDNPLTVQGFMAGRSFEFEREFASAERGAELIIYDGRVVINPPPGFADFVKSLPTFRAIVPQ